MRIGRLSCASIALLLASATIATLLAGHHRSVFAAQNSSTTDVDWPAYDGQNAGDHYSALDQINRSNVHLLRQAWVFDTGEKGGLQTNPLIIGRVLFAFSPTQKVIALDAASGKRVWTFDPGTPGLQPTRGFSYWTDGTHSILFAGILSYLYALDPATGKPISSFGDGGRIDLRKDISNANYTQQYLPLLLPLPFCHSASPMKVVILSAAKDPCICSCPCRCSCLAPLSVIPSAARNLLLPRRTHQGSQPPPTASYT